MLGSVKLQVKGVNLDRLINDLKTSFLIRDVFKVHNTIINFVVPINYYPKIIAYLQSKCYNVNIIQFSFLLNISLFFKKYFLQMILLVLCIGILCTLFNTILGVKIVKQSQYNTSILQALNDCKIYGKWSSKIDCDDVELNIYQKVPQLSLVNASVKGCFVVIDYTLKELPTEVMATNSGPILAQESGVVSKIFVTQGTPLVRVNTYVKAGQPLIGNYFVDKDGNTVECEPKGEVYVYVWHNSTIEFCEDTIQYVPTGEEVVCTNMQVFDKNIVCKNVEIPYDNYCVKQEKMLLTTFVMPIYIVYTHYLQTTPQKVHVGFDSRVDSLKMQARENVLKNIPLQDILEEKYTISYVGDIYFVTYYAKSENVIT